MERRYELRREELEAAAHRTCTSRWPVTTSGPVPEAPGENWSALNTALRVGTRGLPGDSLARLLKRSRGTGTGVASTTPSVG